MSRPCIALIGSAGVPANYGGFETFAEQVGVALVELGYRVIVTCDAQRYSDRTPTYRGIDRIFIDVAANGIRSMLHDAVAFRAVNGVADAIIILGVSMGPFFPLTLASRTRRLVNLDGLEWRREKFPWYKRQLLRAFSAAARRCSDVVVIDNEGLRSFLPHGARDAAMIAYGGDHVPGADVAPATPMPAGFALTVCRIEPENNLDMLIDGFLASQQSRYVVIGNWQASAYGRQLRAQHAGQPRLSLLDPVYDTDLLHDYRRQCAVYLHGHSVGGTNPSLVEMLFYDPPILCFDCVFNRSTALDSAGFFVDAAALTQALDAIDDRAQIAAARVAIRARYRWANVARDYAALCFPAIRTDSAPIG